MGQVMNVLSLFDGISVGLLSLKTAGIKVDNYYSSEIDRYAIQISNKHFPDVIRLGDIKDWKHWNLDWSKIDLVLAGFPCQSWSDAGRAEGIADPRGELALVMLDIWNHIKKVNPKVLHLFENVKMKKEFLNYLDGLFDSPRVLLNSSLVSGQHRERYYWTNIPNVTEPEDKGVVLADILEEGITNRDKSYGIDANYYKGSSPDIYFGKRRRQLVFVTGFEEGRRIHDGKYYSRNFRQGYRIYHVNGLAASLTAHSKGGKCQYAGIYGVTEGDICYYRMLTVLECERLQTLPDGFTLLKDKDGKQLVSNTQRYKCIGNSWTAEIITHIFKNLKMENCNE